MPSDFIDRAALEAKMHAEFPRLPVGTHGADVMERDGFREGFMEGVDAVLALLDAETTEEWGVRHFSVDGWPSDLAHTSKEAAERDLGTCGWNCHLISRRVAVTSWLPSEGGEKRG